MPAGRPPPSVHGRAPACKPRAPHEQLTCERAQVRAAPRARARSLSGGGVAHALATCARPAALVRVGPYPKEADCAGGTAAPPRCTAVLRRASRVLHTSSRLASARKSELRHARALALSREEA